MLRRAELGALHQIAVGGTAKIYRAPDLFVAADPRGQWVYKEYNQSMRPSLFGMQQIAGLLDALEPAQRAQFERCLNWPVAVVADDAQPNRALGMVLPLIPDDYFITIRRTSDTKHKPAEAQYLFLERDLCVEMGVEYPDHDTRLALVHRLCYAIALLHRAGVVFGDMSAKNFVYRLRPRPAVLVVDCDAVRLPQSSAGFGLQPHTQDWEPPEALRAGQRGDHAGFIVQNAATDRYKLGLAILRILTPGTRASNRDPSVAAKLLPGRLHAMLCRALGDDPNDRPAANEWYRELAGAGGGA